jgi:crossover junction endodeoxyribonuclease RuvC
VRTIRRIGSRKRRRRVDRKIRMVIAAVDPGTHKCGYCLLAPEGTRLRLVEMGTIEAGGGTRAARLLEVHDRLAELFARHRPSEVVVERAYVGRNPQTAIVLGEARGLALLCAQRVGARVVEITAPEAKRAMTLNGMSGKDAVQRTVQLLLGLKTPPPPDTADAVALALTHAMGR